MTNPTQTREPIEFRIAFRGQEYAGLSADGHVPESTEIVHSGTYTGTEADPRNWTAAELEFTDTCVAHLYGYLDIYVSYRYVLEILQDGQWSEVCDLMPAADPEPPCPECGKADCDGGCQHDGDEDDVPSTADALLVAYRVHGDFATAAQAVRDDPGSYV